MSIDPPPGAIYIPKGALIYKCTYPGCGATGTLEQVNKHTQEEHRPPKSERKDP